MSKIIFENIPAELKERPQWVLWREVKNRGSRPAKVPYQPDGKEAKSNDPATWTTFDNAVAAYNSGGFAGIGYVFSIDDEFVGIDLDGCYYRRDGLAGWAKEIVNRLGSYAEISPSGSGAKVFVRGKSPFDGGKKKSLPNHGGEGGKEAGIEIYDHGRYFALTGQRLSEFPGTVERCELGWLQEQFWPETVRQPETFKQPEPAKRPAPWERPAQPAPGFVGRLGGDVERRAIAYIDAYPPAISGQGGHSTTLPLVQALVRGFQLPDETAFRLLVAHYNPRCEPPWSEAELWHKIKSAREHPCGKPRGWLLASDDYAPAPAIPIDVQGLVNQSRQSVAGNGQPAGIPPEIVLARDYLTRQPPPDDPISSGRIDRGDKAFFIGQSKSHKSFFVLQYALCLASGKPFLNWGASKPQRVLVIQYELKPAKYWRRVRYVAGACGISADDVGDRLHVLNLRGKLVSLDTLPVGGYDVLVFDPFYKLLAHEGADEIKAPEVARVLSKIDRLAEQGPAVCIVHHDPKGRAGDRQTVDRGSGSGVVARDYDCCFTLTPHRDEPGEWFVLETVLRNYRSPEAQTIEFRDGMFVVRDDVPPEVQTSQTVNRAQQTGPAVESLALIVRGWVTVDIETTGLAERIRTEFNIGQKKAEAVIRQLESYGFVRSKTKSWPSRWIISPPESREPPPNTQPVQRVLSGMG